MARALVPAIAVSTLMSLAEPTFLVVPLGMGLAALLLSFLPGTSPNLGPWTDLHAETIFRKRFVYSQSSH